jgi:hypothetical protein
MAPAPVDRARMRPTIPGAAILTVVAAATS